jgi:hypothetical protein
MRWTRTAGMLAHLMPHDIRRLRVPKVSGGEPLLTQHEDMYLLFSIVSINQAVSARLLLYVDDEDLAI